MILVAGAGGTLGRVLVPMLANAGLSVTAASRSPSRLDVPDGVRTIELDIRDHSSVAAAVAGADTVVCAVHGVAPPTRNNHPGIVDALGVPTLITEAGRAGVRRFVFLSAHGASSDHPARFFRLKHDAERLVRSSSMGWAIIRPAAYMETHALLVMGEPARAGKAVPLIGPATTPLDWVAVGDVAETVAKEVTSGENSTVEIFGPERMSRLEALAVLEEAGSIAAKRRHLPVPVARALSRGARLAHPGVSYMLEAAIAEHDWAPASDPDARRVTGATTLTQVASTWAA